MSEDLALIALTGSRAWPYRQRLEDTLLQVWHDALQDGYTGIELIHGTADGADTMGDEWAVRNDIPRRRKPADWSGPCGPDCQPGHRKSRRDGSTYCPLAGHRRNQQIIDAQPVLLVAARWRGSTGTADCMRRAKTAGIPIWPV